MINISVIVPCFNEAENIKRFPNELFPYFKDAEFIFVDDGSVDRSVEALKNLQNPSLKLIFHQTNRGLGAALRSGFQAAEGDFIVTFDADLTFHPQEFEKLKTAMDEQTACVSGSAVRGEMVGVSWIRRFLSRSVNHFYALLLGADITGASSVFRLYRRKNLLALPLTSESFDINAEILFRLRQNGEKIKEVPVRLTQRVFGESKIKFSREIKNHLKIFLSILAWKINPRKS